MTITDTNLTNLRKVYNRYRNWFAKCEAYSAGTGEAPNLRSMPSKNAKYDGYHYARCAAKTYGITVPADLVGTLHEWAFVLTAMGVKVKPLPAMIPTRAIA